MKFARGCKVAAALMVLAGLFSWLSFASVAPTDRAAAAASSETDYAGPLVITRGGTYTGSWECTDPDTPAVTVATGQPVVINDSYIRGGCRLISENAFSTNINLTVTDTLFTGVNPNVAGKKMGNAIHADNVDNIVIEHNEFVHTGGIRIYNYNGEATDGDRASVRFNKSLNIDGRYSNGAGGWDNVTEVWRQFVQISSSENAPNVEIAWNDLKNEPCESRIEDNISIWKSYARSAADPIEVHHNFVDGSWPAMTRDASGNCRNFTELEFYSGGGIVTDGNATSLSDATGYVDIHHNRVIDTLNYGVGIFAGHDVTISDNRVVFDGKMDDGFFAVNQTQGVNGGYCDDGPEDGPTLFFNNRVHNNYSGWVKYSDGRRNDYWFSSDSGTCNAGNNTSIPDPITQATEDAERTAWESEVTAAGLTIGRRTVPPPPPTYKQGLKGEYYDKVDFTAFNASRDDPHVNFYWGSGAPMAGMGANRFSVRWTGQVHAPTSGTYVFYTTVNDGVRLYIDSHRVIERWSNGDLTNSATVSLSEGWHDLRMEMYEGVGPSRAILEYDPPGTEGRIVIAESRLRHSA